MKHGLIALVFGVLFVVAAAIVLLILYGIDWTYRKLKGEK